MCARPCSMWLPIAFLLALALSFASCSSSSSADDDQTVKLGSQSGVIAAGTAGSVTFAVKTKNIDKGTAGKIVWYTTAKVAKKTSAPTGVTSSVTKVSGNAATVTMTVDATAAIGFYYFTLTEDGIASSAATLLVSGWHTLSSPDLSSGTVYYGALALSSKDVPYLVYSDGDPTSATVKKYGSSSSSWTTVGSAGFSSGVSGDTFSLALGSNDTPYVVCSTDTANSSTSFDVMKYGSSSWATVGSTVGNAIYVASANRNISMAVDSSGIPYVAYSDYSDQTATVKKYNSSSSSWETVGSTGLGYVLIGISLAFSSSDVPYVAYEDYTNSNKATVKKYDSSSNSWETVGSIGFSSSIAFEVMVALDPNDVPYVSYKDYANSYKATVMKYDSSSSSWVTVGSAGFSAGQAETMAIAINSSGVPYVAYKDYGNSNKATVMKYDSSSSSWVTVGSAGFSSGEATYFSLAFDSKDIPYVSFYDGASSCPTVMYYK
jgi:hypothetical protein